MITGMGWREPRWIHEGGPTVRLLRCDRCSKTVPDEDESTKTGWGVVNVTGHVAEADLCPGCVRELKHFLNEAPPRAAVDPEASS
jgi:hypothetical protein